ncbi:uncharacterized protein LOC128680677 [Plodia interpunctella]|uniref:uncharacterized protein LOC128680677 n=1 Tax=Plodia interpunctella TaxID=58824 RepID=UPI0023674541|nr:uncharacterized protein LOC128680677 [Plodia interpunctella]
MQKWTLFWTIILINVIGIDLLDDILVDEYETSTFPKTNAMNPKMKTSRKKKPKKTTTDSSDDYEPLIPLKSRDKVVKGIRQISCVDFTQYAANCTSGAAMIYNAARVTPPLPYKIQEWCKSIRFLTNCAIEWNTDCSEITDNFFNEDSIKGHMHVLDYICDDEWFLNRYRDMSICIEEASEQWEECYSTFKVIVEEQKNITREWTHFETHFYLCCAQAHFRRCTLDFIFNMPKKCPYEQAITLQKFSVIISEGDVFQECDGTIPYGNCPNGDPTPSQNQLRLLMEGDAVQHKKAKKAAVTHLGTMLYLVTAYVLVIFYAFVLLNLYI